MQQAAPFQTRTAGAPFPPHPTLAPQWLTGMGRTALGAALGTVLLASGLTLPSSAQARDTQPPVARLQADNSSMDAALFYQLLLGELQLRNNDPGAAYSLVLDAARRTQRQELYRHAVEIALQARSGNAALEAANAWISAYPNAEEPQSYKLRILLALDRPAEIAAPLRQLIELTPADKRPEFILAVPTLLARTSNKAAGYKAVRQALAPSLAQKSTATAAWHTLARLQYELPDRPGALDAVRKALQNDPGFLPSIGLALDLMEQDQNGAETLVRQYLKQNASGTPRAVVQLGLARVLLQRQRYSEAQQELDQLLAQNPELPDAWLLQGALYSQQRNVPQAQLALEKFLNLSVDSPGEALQRGRTQAQLQLAQLAEQQQDYAGALRWLDQITEAPDPLALQARRAHLLAKQGQLSAARHLIQQTPETKPGDAQRKYLAEAHLLRDQGQLSAALDVLSQACAAFPQDADLLYERAMMADRAGQTAEMERLLRQLMVLQPDHYHAYNALGYSLADRNERLDEAKTLIQKALAGAPNDPYILDSLGWVEFRQGHLKEALRILQDAYRRQPDAEIAAHLGEVLWAQGLQDQARAAWREGLKLNPASETLLQTLKRLQVQP